MTTIFESKELAVTESPLLLFDCVLSDGSQEHWSTQTVTVDGTLYSGRVGRHNLFEFQTASDQGVDSIPRVSIDLANADSHFSEIERATGFKGAKLGAKFVFYDLKQGVAATASIIIFNGIVNSPDLITETTFRLTAMNRLSAQRVVLPQVRLQRRCSWDFPATAAERLEAMDGGAAGRFSRFYRCGYSPDVAGGRGNLNGTVAFTTCAFTRSDCEARGMFSKDSLVRLTSRFSGLEFVPSTIVVRSTGEKTSHLSPLSVNGARYNDFVPLIYGTAWYSPEIVFARNDGNLTHLEVLLGMGEIQNVYKVLVNDIDIPMGRAGTNMTGTGWYNVITSGTRSGQFNSDFTDSSGKSLGDPYGSMAYLSVVVPNRINDGRSLPSVTVLLDGLKVRTYGTDGTLIGDIFSNNPCWIILDVLLRSGWAIAEMDLISFAKAAAFCDEHIQTIDLNGNPTSIPRFQCNLVLQSRRSAGDILRGVRNSGRLFLTFGLNGMLQLKSENSLSLQQPIKPPGSNAQDTLNGGWPAYEFGDGSSGFSGILRNGDGSSSLRLYSRSAADSPNRFSVEFQDAFNEYQQDSFSLVDTDDVAKTGQELAATLPALGIANYDQAARILSFSLRKSIDGNAIIEFQTSVKALGLFPGDIVSLTYLKEGFERQAFRILKIAPGQNYRTATITAQIHFDEWYSDDNRGGNSGGRRLLGPGIGLPRPIEGTTLDANGELQFDITETFTTAPDGTVTLSATVGFIAPGNVPDSAPGIPLISLVAHVTTSGGTLKGEQTLYYAVSAADVIEHEGSLSFVVMAVVPGGTDANEVTLSGLSFPSTATTFHVYRGPNPSQMFRIASDQAISAQFVDAGLPEQSVLPPDPNFDHANFYWRLELQPEADATTHSSSTIGNGSLQMIVNEYRGAVVRITQGKGARQERNAIANDVTTLTVDSAWDIAPDSTSKFVVAQSGYQFGATGKIDRIQFEIPNRPGATVELSGRSANGRNVECPYEMSPVTRWQIGGTGTAGSDADVPGEPVFGVGSSVVQGGSVLLGAIGFADLKNTTSINAGTYTLYYYDELAGPPALSLALAAITADSTITLNASSGAVAGTYIQLDRDIVQVTSVSTDGITLQVSRSVLGSNAADHLTGTAVYVLKMHVTIVPFIHDFFGSPASGSWSYLLQIPNVRVASVQLFVTNSLGNSPAATICLTNNLDAGLRTLSGGQYTVQIAGFLAVQSGATPDIWVEAPHAVRDVFAIVSQAASDAIQLNLNLNGALYCSLSFAANSTSSNAVSGLGLRALNTGDRLSVDVIAVGQTTPGSDLTLVIRV